jgi:hypothetical protein
MARKTVPQDTTPASTPLPASGGSYVADDAGTFAQAVPPPPAPARPRRGFGEPDSAPAATPAATPSPQE